ncbi:hypothetical protein SLEP1_g27787 [Rubroshorea leprosula]|uniref:MULE transposase domain-containing protein n=1 Tax=Rubroshorea leprosula TaxID=152421 RepID=A0AAV5JX31_9ROSI|nr:hypothetical protein SLEP1_g27787 [Rubroshorea leprosula]
MRFNERDCQNYLDHQRQLWIAKGDGEAIWRYFKVLKSQSSNYFSRIEVDADRRLNSLFWVDGQTRAAYQYFDDVLPFDTTYLTNRYDMSCAAFSGANNHSQTIMLSCGLIAKLWVDS